MLTFLSMIRRKLLLNVIVKKLTKLSSFDHNFDSINPFTSIFFNLTFFNVMPYQNPQKFILLQLDRKLSRGKFCSRTFHCGICGKCPLFVVYYIESTGIPLSGNFVNFRNISVKLQQNSKLFHGASGVKKQSSKLLCYYSPFYKS